jgi:adenylate cyclase
VSRLADILRRTGDLVLGKTYAPIAVGLLTLAVVFAVRVWDPPLVAVARLAVFDTYQRAAPRPYRPVPVRVVDIDDPSLAKLGQWPWPRWQVADLVRRLAALGAKVVVFDIVFAEPDRTSPNSLAQDWSAFPELAEVFKDAGALPDFDRHLADSFAETKVVTAVALTREPNDARPKIKASFATVGPDATGYLTAFHGAVGNLEVLENAADGNGSFAVVSSVDEVIRRAPLLQTLDGRIYPALSIEALRVAEDVGTVKIRGNSGGAEGSFGRPAGLERLQVGRHNVPLTPDGNIWVHYTENRPERMVPVWRIMADDGADARIADLIAGHIVLVGTSAAGLKDLRSTPLNPFEPGVLIHAQLIEQILLGWFLDRPA